jgi:hypothetical protein
MSAKDPQWVATANDTAGSFTGAAGPDHHASMMVSIKPTTSVVIRS